MHLPEYVGRRMRLDRTTMVGGLLLGLSAAGLLAAERRRPLRRRTQAGLGREVANAALGAMSMAAMAALEEPLTRRLATRAERDRRGLAQLLPGPAWVRDAAAVLLMDYTIYLWHVLSHEWSALWRFHLVHHADRDLDLTTALRFHAVDMAISAPVRGAQVVLLGLSPRALAAWRGWFFMSVLFHHSNLRLPERWERRLALILTTPRMHGVHHSSVREEAGSNWSSGLSVWDHLHGTFRLDVPQERITIGVPAYPQQLGVTASLSVPFRPQRDDWSRERHDPGA